MWWLLLVRKGQHKCSSGLNPKSPSVSLARKLENGWWIEPALIAQLLHYPLYSGPALTAVWGHRVDNDPLHVGGEGHPLHCHHCLLLHQRPVGVLWIGCVRHLLLHVDNIAEGHVLRSHLHQTVFGVHGWILACIANLNIGTWISSLKNVELVSRLWDGHQNWGFLE